MQCRTVNARRFSRCKSPYSEQLEPRWLMAGDAVVAADVSIENVVDSSQLRPEDAIQLVVSALADQIAIQILQQRWGRVWVLHVNGLARLVCHLDAIP